MNNSTDVEGTRRYYEAIDKPASSKGNLAARAWGRARLLLYRIRKDAGINVFLREKEMQFLGDVTGKRVLEIGAGTGCAVSQHLAKNASYYLAVDLSEPALHKLRARFQEWNALNAEAVQMDFLKSTFPYGPFDIVFASSVVRAFHPLETGIKLVHDRLAPNGLFVLFEPMETSWPIWCIRHVVRPFRSDRRWNWPLDRRSFKTIQRYFEIDAVQGFFGHSKWAVPLVVVPFLYTVTIRLVRQLHKLDERVATSLGRGVWRCNSVILRLRR
ncbi:MAG: class I SAM-dependent methyltransferase, partial [Planctomycetota bacterium]